MDTKTRDDEEAPMARLATDFTVKAGNPGPLCTIYLLCPNTDAAQAWVDDHLPEDAPRLGPNVAIETRYLGAILDGIVADGLTIN